MPESSSTRARGIEVPAQFELVVAAAVSTFFAVVVSGILLYTHFKYYTQPRHQRCIVRLIFMVPLYAVYSLLSLLFMDWQRYFAVFRDAYEAYALYMFFVLCIEYVGGRERMITAFESCSETKLVVPLWCVVKPGRRLLKVCRQGILQYAILRPLVSVVSTGLMIAGYYEEGHWAVDDGYPYATLFYNIGVTVSLYCLALFYKVAREELRPFSPVIKFSVVKGIVFFTYWQSVAVSIAVGLGLVPEVKNWSSGEVATAMQNVLICFEMSLFAVAFVFAFPVRMYRISSRSQAPLIHEIELGTGVFHNVRHAVDQKDIILDTIESFVPGADPTSPHSRAYKKQKLRELAAYDARSRTLQSGDDSQGELRLNLDNVVIRLDDSEDSNESSFELPEDDRSKTNIRGRK